MNRLLVVCGVLGLSVALGAQGNARASLEATAAALGGVERVQAARTLVIEGEGTGTQGLFGQNTRPDGPWPTFKNASVVRQIDMANERMRLRQTRTPQLDYEWPLPNTVQPQDAAIDGTLAFNRNPAGVATRAPGRTGIDRRIEMLHHPLVAVRAALAPGSMVTLGRGERNTTVFDVVTAKDDRFSLIVDSGTRLPLAITSTTYDVNLGDVVVRTSFEDYADVAGLKLPRRINATYDKYSLSTFTVSKQSVGDDVGDLAAPESVRNPPAAAPGGLPAGGPPAPGGVRVEDRGNGVWILGGGYNSVVVEFADHLTLIEVPNNDARTQAVIAAAKQLRPGKPLTEAVVTHHHFDHSGGLRAAVAEGLTIITQEDNVPLFRELVARKHTIVPDALAMRPQALKVRPVKDALTLSDATNELRLYHITGSPHAATLLMGYLPKLRTLVYADVFGAPTVYAKFPHAANLAQQIQRRGLQVDTHISVHGPVISNDELVKVIAGQPARSGQ